MFGIHFRISDPSYTQICIENSGHGYNSNEGLQFHRIYVLFLIALASMAILLANTYAVRGFYFLPLGVAHFLHSLDPPRRYYGCYFPFGNSPFFSISFRCASDKSSSNCLRGLPFISRNDHFSIRETPYRFGGIKGMRGDGWDGYLEGRESLDLIETAPMDELECFRYRKAG